MPEAPELVNLVDDQGNAFAVPVDQLGDAFTRGYRIETSDQAAGRVSTAAREEVYGGVSGTIAAAGLGAARGLTLGASDVLAGAIGEGETVQQFREVNPGASLAGEIGGGVAGAFAAPGSLLARSPAGMVSRLGAKVAGAGEGAGLLARTARTAGGAALEGAASGAGAYISDVALGDKELSADGFMGAMGQGALWGGVAGGALSLSAGGLTAARRLFPRQEMTREAVDAAEAVAKREIASVVDDNVSLRQATNDRLRQIRADAAALDLDTKIKLDDIAVKRAQELADSHVAKAQAQTERAQVQLEKAKTAPGRRTRKAMEATEAPPIAAEVPSEAVAAGAVEDSATLLERQLMGTRAGIEAGETLAEIGARRPAAIGLKPSHVEDALNAEIAKVNPEAARLVKGLTELETGTSAMQQWLGKYSKGGKYGAGEVAGFERGQAARDFAEGMRPKEAGYYTRVPAGEGTVGLPRGREQVWRGSEEARALADAKTMTKLAPEEQLAADDAIADMFARRERRDLARDITEGAPPALDDQVQGAIRSKVDSIDDDIAESAEVISRNEAAAAELVDALGPMAPTPATARAQAFREAQRTAETATQDAAVRATADAEQAAAMISIGGTPPKGGYGGLVEKATDIGTAAEALRMMGIDLPDPRNIPVIGPVLGMYLKARVLGKAFGRFGGKVAATAESTIASKAAATKERVYAAVDKMMDVASKGAAKAAPRAGGVAATLGRALFDSGEPGEKAKPYTSQAPKGSIAEVYLARADEVGRAMQPGAIDRSVRQRIRTSDPAILDAIIAAQTRKLEFLDSKMPKSAAPPIPTQIRMPWVPSRAEISQWGRYVEAAENPAGVIEAAANDGHISIEGVETLRTVYPRLFAEAQQRVLQRAMDYDKPIPYARRVQLSVMFDMPMDGSQTPEGAAFLQQTYQPTPPNQQAQPAMGTPTVTAAINTADRVSPSTKT